MAFGSQNGGQAAIHMWNDSKPAVARCDVGLKRETDINAVPFDPIVSRVGFGSVDMITTSQACIDAVFGEIGVIKIVIFQVNVRC